MAPLPLRRLLGEGREDPWLRGALRCVPRLPTRGAVGKLARGASREVHEGQGGGHDSCPAWEGPCVALAPESHRRVPSAPDHSGGDFRTGPGTGSEKGAPALGYKLRCGCDHVLSAWRQGKDRDAGPKGPGTVRVPPTPNDRGALRGVARPKRHLRPHVDSLLLSRRKRFPPAACHFIDSSPVSSWHTPGVQVVHQLHHDPP